MALVHETGAGLSNAESFASVASADTRMSGFGNDTWATLTTSQKEEALRRATTYMQQAYRARWMGYRQTATQALSWPRNSVVVDGYVVIASDAIPPEVANACIDLAFKAAAGDLNEDLARGVVREKVGPIETEFDRASPQAVRYRAIDMTLQPFLRGGSGMARLERV